MNLGEIIEGGESEILEFKEKPQLLLLIERCGMPM